MTEETHLLRYNGTATFRVLSTEDIVGLTGEHHAPIRLARGEEVAVMPYLAKALDGVPGWSVKAIDRAPEEEVPLAAPEGADEELPGSAPEPEEVASDDFLIDDDLDDAAPEEDEDGAPAPAQDRKQTAKPAATRSKAKKQA